MKRMIITLVAVVALTFGAAAQQHVDTLVNESVIKIQKDSTYVLYTAPAKAPLVGSWFMQLSPENLGEEDTLWCNVGNGTFAATDGSLHQSENLDTITGVSIRYTTPDNIQNFVYTGGADLIPDGGDCGTSLMFPIQVGGYPQGATITSTDQIASICVNIEHSFSGDLDFEVVCPNGSKAPLSLPREKESKSGIMLGIPMGGLNHSNYDALYGDRCDSASNPAGEGWNYCFSRRSDFTLGNGSPCSSTGTTYNFGNAPGVTHSDLSSSADSSDHANRTGYYQPPFAMESLVGCPVNGYWYMKVTDHWAYDNGWFFTWDIDIDWPLDASSKSRYVTVNDVTFWVVYEEVVGMDSPESRTYSVYPNPTMGMLTVDGGDVEEVSLYDLTGRQVASSKGNQVDVSQLPKGAYFLKARAADNTLHTFRVVRVDR